MSGSNITGNVDTTGLAPGSYTVTGTATDAKEKKNNMASCNSSFTVNTPHPPVASCSASPDYRESWRQLNGYGQRQQSGQFPADLRVGDDGRSPQRQWYDRNAGHDRRDARQHDHGDGNRH